MIDSKAFQIVRAMLDAQRTARRDRFDIEISRLLTQAIKHGGLYSSGHFFSIEGSAAIEVEDAAHSAWATMHRVIISTGVAPDPTLVDALKREFASVFAAYCEGHPSAVVEDARKKMGPAAPPAAAGKFAHRSISARLSIDAEIDLFVRSLEFNARAAAQSSPGTVFNFYHPVGVVQAGAGSTATIVQNFTAESRQELIGALDSIATQLVSAQQLSADEAHEIREAIDETRHELQKADPGRAVLWAKLQTVVMLVAAAIPAYPSLQTGFHALTSILRGYGLPVP
jgi:hypothetical protein